MKSFRLPTLWILFFAIILLVGAAFGSLHDSGKVSVNGKVGDMTPTVVFARPIANTPTPTKIPEATATSTPAKPPVIEITNTPTPTQVITVESPTPTATVNLPPIPVNTATTQPTVAAYPPPPLAESTAYPAP